MYKYLLRLKLEWKKILTIFDELMCVNLFSLQIIRIQIENFILIKSEYIKK